MNEVKLLIGGRDCDASDKATFKRLNPVTGEVASRAAAATLADADAACDAAAEAFPAWAAMGPNERRKLLLKRQELKRLRRKIVEKGNTIVPLKAYFVRGKVKVLIGLATGKRQYDKREAIKKRDIKRDQERSRK